MAYPNNQREQAPEIQTRYNEGGGRSKWRLGRGWVKQIGDAPRPAVQWDAQLPALTNPFNQPHDIDPGMAHTAPGNIDPGMTPGFDPYADSAPKPALGMNGVSSGGALSTPGAAGAQGLTDNAAWNHLFPHRPDERTGPNQPGHYAPGTDPAKGLGRIAPPPSAAPNPQYLTPGTAAPEIHSAPPAAADWQQQIVAQYPMIGKAGSPEHTAFVSAFNAHGAPGKGMDTAHEVMRAFQPKPNIAARGPEMRDTPELTPGIRNEARRVDPYAMN